MQYSCVLFSAEHFRIFATVLLKTVTDSLQILYYINDKKYIKMKERERHLPESSLQTLLEQTDHDESGYISGAFSQHCGFHQL